jgi:hypothetical protein
MNHINAAIAKYADLVALAGGYQAIRRDALLILDGTPCNEKRGWYGMKPGCTRGKPGSPKNAPAARKVAQSKPKKMMPDLAKAESAGEKVIVETGVPGRAGGYTIPATGRVRVRAEFTSGSRSDKALRDMTGAGDSWLLSVVKPPKDAPALQQ